MLLRGSVNLVTPDPADRLTQRAMQIEQNVLMHDLDVRHNTAGKNTIKTWLLKQLTVPKVRDWVVSNFAADLE